MLNCLKACVVGSGVLLACSPAHAGTTLEFRSLDECRASEAQTKADADRAEAVLGAVAQPLSQAFNEALTKRNALLGQLSDIRSACSKLAIARKAIKGELAKESASSQVSQMNELHELLSDQVLKAVPNKRVREIQSENLGTVRSQMVDLAKVLDGTVASMNASETLSATSTRTTLVGRPDPAVGNAVLGADAAAALDQDVRQWRVAEAARQEKLRREEEVRQADAARQAAERARLAQIEFEQAQARAEADRQQSSSGFGSILTGILTGVAIGVSAKHGGYSALPAMSSYGGGGNSQSCQQALAQIESDRLSIQSLQQAQQGGVGLQAIQQTIADGQAAIQSNQNWYNQNCR